MSSNGAFNEMQGNEEELLQKISELRRQMKGYEQQLELINNSTHTNDKDEGSSQKQPTAAVEDKDRISHEANKDAQDNDSPPDAAPLNRPDSHGRNGDHTISMEPYELLEEKHRLISPVVERASAFPTVPVSSLLITKASGGTASTGTMSTNTGGAASTATTSDTSSTSPTSPSISNTANETISKPQTTTPREQNLVTAEVKAGLTNQISQKRDTTVAPSSESPNLQRGRNVSGYMRYQVRFLSWVSM